MLQALLHQTKFYITLLSFSSRNPIFCSISLGNICLLTTTFYGYWFPWTHSQSPVRGHLAILRSHLGHVFVNEAFLTPQIRMPPVKLTCSTWASPALADRLANTEPPGKPMLWEVRETQLLPKSQGKDSLQAEGFCSQKCRASMW